MAKPQNALPRRSSRKGPPEKQHFLPWGPCLTLSRGVSSRPARPPSETWGHLALSFLQSPSPQASPDHSVLRALWALQGRYCPPPVGRIHDK